MPAANGHETRYVTGKFDKRALLSSFHNYEPTTRGLLSSIIEHGGGVKSIDCGEDLLELNLERGVPAGRAEGLTECD